MAGVAQAALSAGPRGRATPPGSFAQGGNIFLLSLQLRAVEIPVAVGVGAENRSEQVGGAEVAPGREGGAPRPGFRE